MNGLSHRNDVERVPIAVCVVESRLYGYGTVLVDGSDEICIKFGCLRAEQLDQPRELGLASHSSSADEGNIGD